MSKFKNNAFAAIVVTAGIAAATGTALAQFAPPTMPPHGHGPPVVIQLCQGEHASHCRGVTNLVPCGVPIHHAAQAACRTYGRWNTGIFNGSSWGGNRCGYQIFTIHCR